MVNAGALTGLIGSDQYFQITEVDGFQPELILDVLDGKLAGVIYRGVVSPDMCRSIAERFWLSEARKRRGADAPGYYLGAIHYGKDINSYIEESEESAEALDVVLGESSPIDMFEEGIARVLAPRGAIFRLAGHEGRQASRALLRSWNGFGEYALAPHEDGAQIREPKQRGFEIQQVANYNVLALNICLENGNGGRLAYWNIRPDNAARAALGIDYTGIPYPTESLADFEQKWVEVRPGDVYVFNGAHVHAVEPNTDPEKRRTTLAAMFGFIDDRTVVSWT